MVSAAYANAMAETLWYLRGIRKEDINKIPTSVINYLIKYSNKDYKCNFDYNAPMEDMHLLAETKVLITSICYSYWCDDEIEKAKLREILQKNEKEYETWQRELYDPNKIFEKNNQAKANIDSEDMALVEKPKENLFIKMINRIRKILRKNNQSQVNNVEAEQAIAVKPKESLFTKMINRIRRMFGKGNN